MMQGDTDKEKREHLEQSEVYRKKEQEWLDNGDYKDLHRNITEQSSGHSDPCIQFDLFSKAISTLIKMHETYTPRPVVFGLLFTPHRSTIRAQIKEFENERDQVQTACILRHCGAKTFKLGF